MSTAEFSNGKMRTLRFRDYGQPGDVLRLEEAMIPKPVAGTVGIRVHACGLNPADWALCQGLFARDLPRGIGLDVAGIVTALGEGVSDVAIGDPIFGPADFVRYPSAGASDYAVLNHWAPIPQRLGYIEAAALPMAVETASRYIAFLKLRAGETALINGAGTMVGFAAVQIALLQGARVIASAGKTFAGQLRDLGALVVPHGTGMVSQVRALLPQPPDHVLDCAPVNLNPALSAASALADLVEISGGDATRVVTISDHANAAKLGVRTGMEDIRSVEDVVMHWSRLGEFAQRAADGQFSIPIGRTFKLEDWRQALDVSLSGQARGKLVLLTDPDLES